MPLSEEEVDKTEKFISLMRPSKVVIPVSDLQYQFVGSWYLFSCNASLFLVMHPTFSHAQQSYPQCPKHVV